MVDIAGLQAKLKLNDVITDFVFTNDEWNFSGIFRCQESIKAYDFENLEKSKYFRR